jgi:hypothetical protein
MSGSATASAEFRTLFHGSASWRYVGNERGLFLIRQSGAWAECWRGLHSRRQPVPLPPPVDLDRETVIVLAVGTRPVQGFHVTVEDVAVRDETLVVTATETRHVGPGLEAICSPVHVVAALVGTRPFEKMLLNLLIEPAED